MVRGRHADRIDPGILDAYLDPVAYPASEYTYAAMAASGNSVGAGTRMVQVFSPEPAPTNTHVPIESQSVVFD